MAAHKKLLPPTDTDVKVPAAVLAAAARAEQIHGAAYTPPDEPAPVEPGQEPAQAPAEPTPVAPPAPAPVVSAPMSEDTWEHKYNSMKGRAERESNINRGLVDRMASLEATIATMSAPAPAAPTAQEPLVTQAEVAEYGSEFLDVVGRRAAERINPEVAALKQQIEQLESKLGNVGSHIAQDARTRMQSQLTDAVPNWREINTNEKFLDWLALSDPYSGHIRLVLLKSAYAANDTPRVLNFFNGFLAEEAAAAPQVNQPDPLVAPATPKVPLETLAAPGRAKSAATPSVPPEKPTITRAFITDFYADCRRGAYRGRDDEKARIEALIFEANKTGRIV